MFTWTLLHNSRITWVHALVCAKRQENPRNADNYADYSHWRRSETVSESSRARLCRVERERRRPMMVLGAGGGRLSAFVHVRSGARLSSCAGGGVAGSGRR